MNHQIWELAFKYCKRVDSRGTATIPNSANPNRNDENTHILDFELSEVDMGVLDALDQGGWTGPDSDNFNF